MANIKDIFQDACNTANIRLVYGNISQITDQIKRIGQARGQAKYPCVIVFNQHEPQIEKHYNIYSDVTVLIVKLAINTQIESKNDVVFDDLSTLKTDLIQGMCKTNKVSGIFPSIFSHKQIKKLLQISTDKVCTLEITFEEIITKKCI